MCNNLIWTTYQTLKNLELSSENDTRGIYIFGFNFERGFIPYYVGKSNEIHKRIFEHVSSFLGGDYTIFRKETFYENLNNKELFKENKELQKIWEVSNKINEKGIVYNPTNLECKKWFVENINLIQPHIFNMLELFQFTYTKFDKDKEEEFKLSLYDLEKIVINSYNKENLWNTRGGKFKLDNINLPDFKNM